MPILSYKKAFTGRGDLFYRWYHRIGEDVFLDPGITGIGRLILSDGVQQKEAVLRQAAADKFHVEPIVFAANMLELTD